jgi:hypothetical protein
MIVASEDELHHSPSDDLKHCIRRIACKPHNNKTCSLILPLHEKMRETMIKDRKLFRPITINIPL